MARIGSICLILFSMWVALVSSAWAQATPGYTIHQVTFPGSLETYGHAVNDRQDILGAYVPSDTSEVGRLFTKFGATYADLELPVPEVLCHDDPFALNTQRHIAGFFCDLTTESGDVVTSFERVGGEWQPVGVPEAITTVVTGNNDGDSLVGRYFLPRSTESRPFLLTAAGVVDLPPPPVSGLVQAHDVNNRRQIVGNIFLTETQQHRGFVLEDGVYRLFSVPGAASFLRVSGINDQGQIVGSYFTGRVQEPGQQQIWHGFLLQDGVVTVIKATKDASTFPAGINNRGDIVGTFHRPQDGWLAHGFLAVPKASK